ncbi:hypothetical protein POTOM_060886 [Populus tomentosa]|uniref:Uncharacterized protein n=1 Tax=Populus tomentosa TaxID=118781 RepID=A0A8X7XU15_POPTO|nr:hypothetical protein POTOM_060886 [Populus tomentosa]
MAKSKRKPAAAIKRPQDPLYALVPSYTNQGGSLVLGLKSTFGMLDGSISHIPSTYLPSFPAVIPSSGTGTSTAKEADGSPVDNTNASLDGFIMEDCSDDEDLEEEQLDFSCFEEEYERSPPSSPTLVTLEPPASPKGKKKGRTVEKVGPASVATKEYVKGSVFSRLNPVVDPLVYASPTTTHVAEVSPIDAPPVNDTKFDVPIALSGTCVA